MISYPTQGTPPLDLGGEAALPQMDLCPKQGWVVALLVGRPGPNLEPETAGVCGMNGLKNGLNTTHTHLQVLGHGTTFLPMFKPFREPLITYTHTVPGSRLGPDLPRANCVKRSTGHPHPHRQRTTPPTPTHTRDKNNITNPQTNTPHKQLPTRVQNTA